MLGEMPSSPTLRAVSIAAAIAVGANVVFWVLSMFYFSSKVTFSHGAEVAVYDAADQLDIRLEFAWFTLIVAAAGIGSALHGNRIGHFLMALMGVWSLAAGVAAAVKGLPPVLAATELVLGGVLIAIVPLSWRGSRGAWSFLVAIAAVYAVVLFFGAPKVRAVLDIGLWSTLILPGLNAVALVALVRSRARYRT
jgi:hypothetical protein